MQSPTIRADPGIWREGRRAWKPIGCDPGQWEETWTMNVLRTHVYNDGARGRMEEHGITEHCESMNEVTKFKRDFFHLYKKKQRSFLFSVL